MKILFGLVIAVSMVFLLLGAVSVANASGDMAGMNCNCNTSVCKEGGCNCGMNNCNCNDCKKTTSVPEPSTFILFGSMLIGAFGVKKVITG